MWDGTVSGRRRFRPRFVGVVDVSEYFPSGDVAVSPPGASVFMNLTKSAISQQSWGFHNVRDDFVLRDRRCRLPFVGIVGV